MKFTKINLLDSKYKKIFAIIAVVSIIIVFLAAVGVGVMHQKTYRKNRLYKTTVKVSQYVPELGKIVTVDQNLSIKILGKSNSGALKYEIYNGKTLLQKSDGTEEKDYLFFEDGKLYNDTQIGYFKNSYTLVLTTLGSEYEFVFKPIKIFDGFCVAMLCISTIVFVFSSFVYFFIAIKDKKTINILRNKLEVGEEN